MKKLRNIHPGEILSKEFLNPMGLTRYRLSRDTGLLQTSIAGIIRGTKKNYTRNSFEAIQVFW